MPILRLGACIVLCAVGILTAVPVTAQEHQHPAPDTLRPGWNWSGAAAVFLGANLQTRKFTDFRQIESQNWFMTTGTRDTNHGRLTLHTMFSLEPITLRRLGSAQAFQTGETYDGAPLIDYQHPHDFFMALEMKYERPAGSRGRLWIAAAPVGAAAFGPEAFMHRSSARLQPTAPLSHHHIDSTHLSRSVISAGASGGAVSIEVSTFKGQEPDENRWDLDLGVPDSWTARLSWKRSGWRAQFSGGRLKAPEIVEPFLDVTKVSASLEYDGLVGGREFALTIAAGRNREFYGVVDGVLIETAWRATRLFHTYARAEVVDKNILTAGGLHPRGFTHPHEFSTVGAITFGVTRDIRQGSRDSFAAGVDFTTHAVPKNLQDSYGTRPYSVHLFLRWTR